MIRKAPFIKVKKYLNIIPKFLYLSDKQQVYWIGPFTLLWQKIEYSYILEAYNNYYMPKIDKLYYLNKPDVKDT